MKFIAVGDTMHSFIWREKLERYRNILGISASAMSLLALWFIMVVWLMGDIIWPQLASAN